MGSYKLDSQGKTIQVGRGNSKVYRAWSEGAGGLYTCPYPLKAQAHPPRDRLMVILSTVSEQEGIRVSLIYINMYIYTLLVVIQFLCIVSAI